MSEHSDEELESSISNESDTERLEGVILALQNENKHLTEMVMENKSVIQELQEKMESLTVNKSPEVSLGFQNAQFNSSADISSSSGVTTPRYSECLSDEEKPRKQKIPKPTYDEGPYFNDCDSDKTKIVDVNPNAFLNGSPEYPNKLNLLNEIKVHSRIDESLSPTAVFFYLEYPDEKNVEIIPICDLVLKPSNCSSCLSKPKNSNNYSYQSDTNGYKLGIPKSTWNILFKKIQNKMTLPTGNYTLKPCEQYCNGYFWFGLESYTFSDAITTELNNTSNVSIIPEESSGALVHTNSYNRSNTNRSRNPPIQVFYKMMNTAKKNFKGDGIVKLQAQFRANSQSSFNFVDFSFQVISFKFKEFTKADMLCIHKDIIYKNNGPCYDFTNLRNADFPLS